VPSFVQASRFSLGENCEHASDDKWIEN
jgi:hypothetical protein